LRELEATHPVRLEPDVYAPPEVRLALSPANAWWSPTPGNLSPPALSEDLIAQAKFDRQLRGLLAWRAFIDARWACERGFIERALLRFAELQQLVPKDERFQALRDQCGRPTAP
jgi:hypothetical protein